MHLLNKNYIIRIFTFLYLFFSFFITSAISEGIRENIASGIFYPGQSEVLKKNVRKFLELSPAEKNKKNINLFILPHSSYNYIGDIVVEELRFIREEFDTLIIITESHKKNSKKISINNNLYKTPFGVIKLHKSKSEEIIRNIKSAIFYSSLHEKEYGIEVLLPFFQPLNKEFRVIPIVIGQKTKKITLKNLSRVLSSLWDSKTIIVGSVNIFKTDINFDLKKYLEGRLDEDIFYNFIMESKYICGKKSLFTLLSIAKLLGYHNLSFNFQNIPSANFGYSTLKFSTTY